MFEIEPDVKCQIWYQLLATLFNSIFDNRFILQKKSLLSLYESKVKDIVKKLLTLDGNSEMYVLGKIVFLLISLCFEVFNS